jgi:hypothetical protein
VNGKNALLKKNMKNTAETLKGDIHQPINWMKDMAMVCLGNE